MPADEYPGGGINANYKNSETKLWMDRMGAKGWVVPTWPKEYGGGGLDAAHARVLHEEMGRINARPAHVGMGISMIGPALLEYGNDEQKALHLPKIAKGEIWWCQGYSEPNSGSDLASLQTKAVVDGDDYIINGQKVWTSGADNADWIFCLVRTDPKAPKHQGITFILFDMSSPGVSVKPIKLISGLSPFCETFFADVRVPRKNVVSNVNEGWTVAKRLLEYERTSIGGGIGGGQKSRSLRDVAIEYIGTENGKLADLDLRNDIVQQSMDDRAFGLTVRRSSEESKSTKAPSFGSSMFKLYGTEQNKSKHELMLRAMGSQMLGWEGDGFEADELTLTRAWLRTKANSIEGGTTEVQLNIIAKRVLGLPD
ncbi:MAG: alkylation response protein AidB-like acyl-CoA dehydrogenase [Candidatus Azotimanducaceae bacterium]|jgi:alkylation response protein AidB-like acyl-CoA dehydrogenase